MFEWSQQETSTVRYKLSRPLTWSERESFRQWATYSLVHTMFDGIERVDYVSHKFNPNDTSVVTIEAYDDSRDLTELLAKFLADSYLNVHPTSAKTINPKVVV